MGIQFQQGDTVAPCGTVIGCSGDVLANTPQARLAAVGGGAGVTPLNVVVDNIVSEDAAVMFEFTPAAGALWNAGLYSVSLNVTTGEIDLVWVKTTICRFNSSCVNQETLGSLTTGAPTVLSAGVKAFIVSCSAATPSVGDKIYVILSIKSLGNEASPSRNFDFTPSQLISTPITLGTQTICDPGRMIFGGLSLTSTLFPRVRPQKPEVPLDVVIP